MRRGIAAVVLGSAAVLAPAPAHADHICVTYDGTPVVCAPDLQDVAELLEGQAPEEVCVSYGGSNVICV